MTAHPGASVTQPLQQSAIPHGAEAMVGETRDCNSGIDSSIPGSRIKKSLILGSRFKIWLTDWMLFSMPIVALLTLFHAQDA